MPQGYFIKTYGCQMNLADSEKLAGVLASAGYNEAPSEKEAEIILVNTCVVRKHAEDRAAGYISSLKGLKSKMPQLKIGVCGCLVTEPGIKVSSLFPHVDIFIAPNQPEKLDQYLKQLHYSPSPPGRGGRVLRAGGGEGIIKYVTIMHGCDNFCSYCIVPYVRGREYSRPIDEILAEIEQIDLNKHPEIFLLGQNVNSYKYGLAELLGKIEKMIVESSKLKVESSELKKSPRIRFMTSHPRDMSDMIIDAVAELPHVCEYFHLPVQHGDDHVLKSMNRGYSSADYLKLLDKIRKKMPNAAITSDVIVGYPGETDAQFRHTLYIIEQAGFDACNTAAYSVRPGTAASKLADDVPDKIKQERLQAAMAVVERVARERNQGLVGTVQEVLVDQSACQPVNQSINNDRRTGRPEDRQTWQGRTRGNKIVKFVADKNNLLGRVVDVRITLAGSWVLKGELINGKC